MLHLYKIKARQQSDAVLGLIPAFQPLLGTRHDERPVVCPVAGRQAAVLDSRRNFGEILAESGYPEPLKADLHLQARWAGSVTVTVIGLMPPLNCVFFFGLYKIGPAQDWHGLFLKCSLCVLSVNGNVVLKCVRRRGWLQWARPAPQNCPVCCLLRAPLLSAAAGDCPQVRHNITLPVTIFKIKILTISLHLVSYWIIFTLDKWGCSIPCDKNTTHLCLVRLVVYLTHISRCHSRYKFRFNTALKPRLFRFADCPYLMETYLRFSWDKGHRQTVNQCIICVSSLNQPLPTESHR